MSSPDLFDAYFRRADADRDGRISGPEAVAFFQGANLHREVLAKIWQYADQRQSGYLSRAEFYNALKLVTVAQSGRELTPAIVSRALTGPAASQIPPPQIQFPPGSGSLAAGPVPVAVRPPVLPTTPTYPAGQPTGTLQQSTGSSPLSRGPSPPTSTPTAVPGGLTEWPTNKSASWSGPSSGNSLGGQPSQVKAASPPQDAFQSGSFQAGTNSGIPKAASTTESDLFGGDVFTALPAKTSVVSSAPQISQTSSLTNQMPQVRGLQTSSPSDPSTFALVPTSAPVSTTKQIQPVPIPPSQQDQGFGVATTGSDGTRAWPKMTDATVRRYTKIFSDVDTDSDGKISGIQARDLFLSWRLPREVLKQIWDLSDQDRDSMLSLREFCVALYLMERHRDNQVLPGAINTTLLFDDSGIKALRISEAQVAVKQNSAGYNLPAWQQNPSVLQTSGPGLPPRPVVYGSQFQRPPISAHHGQTPVRPSVPVVPVKDGFVPGPQKPKVPVLEMQKVNQLSADDQLTLQTKHQDAFEADKKVNDLENQIMDSKEKMEFYRAKMQEIVLFKTRCDNRLAEITERAAADKREVESLIKRYEEKFKQAGESQSRLLADEAAFRDIQERRLELYNAILRMEQGGDTNALLQVRADRLQSDLDELKKALNAKCKQFGLKVKPTSLLELPYGWQPGTQENAAQWDEDWDKFEDEGFTYVQEFLEEGTAGSDSVKPKTPAIWDENDQLSDGFDVTASDGDARKDEAASNENHRDSSPVRDQDDVASRNGDASPRESHLSTKESGLDIFSSTKDSERHNRALSQSESDDIIENGNDWASAFNHHKGDDTESNASWGHPDVSSSKASEESIFLSNKTHTDSKFGFEEDFPSFGPIRTKEQTSVFFDNSVPSTPLNNNASLNHFPTGGFFDESVPSTPLQHGHGLSQDQFFRFDSFNSNTTDSFSRFDSFNSSAMGQARGMTSFDESDPFSGTGPFRGGQTPRRSTDAWNAFS